MKDIASINGYSENLFDKIIRKRIFKLKNVSTFRNGSYENTFISIPVHHYTKDFERIFRDRVLRVTIQTVQSLFENPKDKIQNFENLGIYEIKCNDCNENYVGESQQSNKTRFKEQLAPLIYD